MDLSPAERAILVDVLLNGDDIPSNIADRTGYARETVSRRCKTLADRSLVEDKGGGVYRLTLAGVRTAQNLQRE